MNQPPIEVSLAYLHSKVKSRLNLYEVLSQKYRLPAYTSRAITAPYLLAYCESPCRIFRITRKDFQPPYIVTKHVTAVELWKAIEGLLKAKNQLPLGLEEGKLPDFEWLVGVYFFLSQNDELKLFPKYKRNENMVTRVLDPE